ncbi:MFS transporter [Kribbella italica]|uniref:Putative MFS family arabinose efflux permease n=1 Tax=Kribbella italica TaxID=1540520 RepID=A0A7W9MV59_9ACTN|nr:MFS transporter [Kribbella italica]MBB5836865.1 putative MFS family arabinose efflux permease [Kribbella italica]
MSGAVLVRTPVVRWLGVVAVTLGIFSIVTAEILPIGLLTPIGNDFGLSPGRTGWLMTAPGLVAAVAAPVVTVTTGRVDRRVMLGVLMVVLAGADLLAAAAGAYWLELVSRVLVGLVIGGFWSIGAGLAGRLVPEHQAGRATGVIFSAVPLGSVLGVPAGTFLGEHGGWRFPFVLLAGLSLLVLVALILFVPPLPAEDVTRLAVLREVLRLRQTRVGLVATCLIVVAHFGTYTYVTPFLREVTGVRPELISSLLLVYGVAGLVGNAVAGLAVGRWLRLTFTAAACLLALATLLLPLLGRTTLGAAGLLVVWGLAYGAVPVCSMSWFAAAAPQAREAATVLFTSSFQATLSAGALAGGLLLDRTSVSVVMVCGGLTALVMAGVLLRGDAEHS